MQQPLYASVKFVIDDNQNDKWDVAGAGKDLSFVYGKNGYLPVGGDWNQDGAGEIETF